MKETFAYTAIDYVSDAAAIPVPDGSFDAILCTEVLEHVPEPIEVLRELGRIVRPGGRLFLSSPLGSGLHQEPHHYYGGYTPHFYRRFLPEAGFRVVSVEPNGGYFLHLAQEMVRAAAVIQRHYQYPRWHPTGILLRYCLAVLGPLWFARVEQHIPMPEFTVGFHVEAVRGEDVET
jgi:SAM-dependent methyltransferase